MEHPEKQRLKEPHEVDLNAPLTLVDRYALAECFGCPHHTTGVHYWVPDVRTPPYAWRCACGAAKA